MKIYRLEQRQFLPINKSICWKFFSDPTNLQKITPPEMSFEIQSELPESIYPGQIIMYRIKLLPGIKISWVTEITQSQEGNYFIDEQRFGPYKFWHHQHIFNELTDGMEIRDIVHYSVPAGILGRIVNWFFIRHRLKYIFEFRKNFLEVFFGPK